MIHKNRIMRELAIWLAAASTIFNATNVNVYSNIPRQRLEFRAKKSIDDMFDLKLFYKDFSLIDEYNIKPRFISERELDKYIDNVYRRFKIPEYITKNFIKKRIELESNGNAHAISPMGARGLSQLTLGAWNQVDNSNFNEYWSDPQKNIDVASKYDLWLSEYLVKNNPDWGNLSDEEKRRVHSAAYNGGLHRLEKENWNVDKMGSETKNYINKISNYPDSVMTN